MNDPLKSQESPVLVTGNNEPVLQRMSVPCKISNGRKAGGRKICGEPLEAWNPNSPSALALTGVGFLGASQRINSKFFPEFMHYFHHES